MSREIWNEGRVVGLSAYEIYVKQFLIDHPDEKPLSEREWLKSSLAIKQSMILKVPFVTVPDGDVCAYVDIPLPEDSNLCACNTIVADFFNGDCEFDGNWATSVTSYSMSDVTVTDPITSTDKQLGLIDTDNISNGYHIPSQIPCGMINYKESASSDSADIVRITRYERLEARLRNYSQIIDGVVLHSGTWEKSGTDITFEPNLADLKTTVRLLIRYSMTESGLDTSEEAVRPFVLLTGFTDASIAQSIVHSMDMETDNNNGSFLGPIKFPWASKIVFNPSSIYAKYFLQSSYSRKLGPIPSENPDWYDPSNPDSPVPETNWKNVLTKSVIDLTENEFYENYLFRQHAPSKPGLYELYAKAAIDPRKEFLSVADIGQTVDNETNVLTVYTKKLEYPPALYSTHSEYDDDESYLEPVDVVAPGSVKIFHDRQDVVTRLKDYQNTFPGTTAINKKTDGSLQVLDDDDKLVTLITSGYGDLDVRYLGTTTIHNESTGANIKAFLHRFNGIDTENVAKTLVTEQGNPYYIEDPTTHELIPDPSYTGKVYYTGYSRPRLLQINLGDEKADVLMMSDTSIEDPEDLTHDPIDIVVSETPPSTIQLDKNNSDQNICWSALLEGLRHNRSIDLLGSRLKSAKDSLLGDNLGSSAYLEFGTVHPATGGGVLDDAPMRFYVSPVAPPTANIPEGSIGIGWGFDQ